MTRRPEIEGARGHGSSFRRFARESDKFHRHQAPFQQKPSVNPSLWSKADPQKFYDICHEIVVKGCELPSSVLPINASETNPPFPTKVRVELRVLKSKVFKRIKAEKTKLFA
ncbi:MAG: hypothetical protein Q8Q15_03895 [bacterium]|nr:hypothetical protein [bacterium]